MAGFALILSGFALLAAVFAWLVLTAPTTPDAEAAPTARDASVQAPVEAGGAPFTPPASGVRLVAFCSCCGELVWFATTAELVTHLRMHAEPPEVARDIEAWEREVQS